MGYPIYDRLRRTGSVALDIIYEGLLSMVLLIMMNKVVSSKKTSPIQN